MRASDPMYELGMTLGGHGKEDKHWQHTVWSRATNIWHNAGIRSGIYMTGAPIRLIKRPFRRGG